MVREREFVVAARVAGASSTRIMFRHLLPNVLPLVFVLTAIDAGSVILLESGLSFLGLGISPPTPSQYAGERPSESARGPWLV